MEVLFICTRLAEFIRREESKFCTLKHRKCQNSCMLFDDCQTFIWPLMSPPCLHKSGKLVRISWLWWNTGRCFAEKLESYTPVSQCFGYILKLFCLVSGLSGQLKWLPRIHYVVSAVFYLEDITFCKVGYTLCDNQKKKSVRETIVRFWYSVCTTFDMQFRLSKRKYPKGQTPKLLYLNRTNSWKLDTKGCAWSETINNSQTKKKAFVQEFSYNYYHLWFRPAVKHRGQPHTIDCLIFL